MGGYGLFLQIRSGSLVAWPLERARSHPKLWLASEVDTGQWNSLWTKNQHVLLAGRRNRGELGRDLGQKPGAESENGGKKNEQGRGSSTLYMLTGDERDCSDSPGKQNMKTRQLAYARGHYWQGTGENGEDSGAGMTSVLN